MDLQHVANGTWDERHVTCEKCDGLPLGKLIRIESNLRYIKLKIFDLNDRKLCLISLIFIIITQETNIKQQFLSFI